MPLIDVEVSNTVSGYSHIGTGLIDSGATGIVLNSEIANALRINLRPCKEIEVGGIGGKKGRVCSIKFQVPSLGYTLDKIDVVFVDEPPFDVIIGQRQFFEDFDVKFMKRDNTFALNKR